MVNEKKAGVASRRVYSYMDENGDIFYSFVKTRQTVSTGKRLILQSRNGTPFLPFMVFMRGEALDKEASIEDVPQLDKNNK